MTREERSKRFAEWLKQARQSADLTQEELAQRAGVSKGYISKLESSSRHSLSDAEALPSSEKVLALAHACRADANAGMIAAGYASEQLFAQQKQIADDWQVDADEYDAFDLSDDPVIQALATGLDSDAIEAARSAMLENGRMTLAEFVKKRRAEGTIGGKAEG